MPSSTAVFRAVADFKSLNRGVSDVRREIAALKREASDSSSFRNLDSALTRVAAEQKKLRTQTSALAAARKNMAVAEKSVADSLNKSGKAGSASTTVLRNYEKVVRSVDRVVSQLAEKQRAASDTTTLLSDEHNKSASSLATVSERVRALSSAESEAVKSARSHTDALKNERTAADSKSGVLTRLTAQLASLTAYERDAAGAADLHTRALGGERSSLSGLASVIRGHADATKSLNTSNDDAASSTARLSRSVRESGSSSSQAQSFFGRLSQYLRDYSARAQHSHGATLTLRRALIALIIPALPTALLLVVHSVVALAGALVGVIGAAAPAAGAIAALGPAALAAAGGIGVALLAFRGVGAALKAQKAASLVAERQAANSTNTDKQQADARASAAGRVLDAQDRLRAAVRAQASVTIDADRQIEDAERSLARSHEDTKRALADLHAERRQAIRDLEDMRNASEDAALSVESANIALIDAQDELKRVLTETSTQSTSTINVGALQIDVASVSPNKPATELEKRKARLAVAEAEQRVEEANLRSARAKDDLNVSEQKGIEGSDIVVAASQRIIDAKEREMLAERDLLSLRRDIADRQIAVDESVFNAQRDLQAALQTSLDSTSNAVDTQFAAQTRLNDLLSRMSPEGKAFVAFLESLIPVLDRMSQAAQTALFPGLTEAIKILLPLVDTVAIPTIEAFGRALSNLSINAATRLKGLEKDFKSFGTSDGPQLLEKFGTIVFNLGEAVWHVVMAAIPLTQWLADLGVKFSKYLKDSAEAGRESGKLADFFDRVKSTLKLLGEILLNVGGILFSVFKGGAPLGQRLLESFRDLTERTDKFLKTAEGTARIKKYFDDMEPSIRIIFRLLGKLAGAILGIGASGLTAKLLKQVEEKLVPAMERLGSAIAQVADKVGSKFIDLLTTFLDIITKLVEAGDGGGFAAFVTVLGIFADALNLILGIPGIAQLGSWLLAIAGGLLAIKVLGKIPGLGAIGRGLNSLAGGAAAARAGDVTTGKSPRTFATGFAGGLGGSDVPARTATARTGGVIGRGLRGLGASLGFSRFRTQPAIDDLPDDTGPPRSRRTPVVDPLYGPGADSGGAVPSDRPPRRRRASSVDVGADLGPDAGAASARERYRQRIRDMEGSGAVPPMRRRLPPVDWAEPATPPPAERRRRTRIPGTLSYEEEGATSPRRSTRPDLNVPDASGESPRERARRRTREMLAAEDFPFSPRRSSGDLGGPSTHGSFLVDSKGPVTVKSSGPTKVDIPHYADFGDGSDHRTPGLARQLGGAAVSTAGAIGGSLAGEAIGQKFGGDTGGMVGSIAGGLAGSFAPDILAAGFRNLGPLLEGTKTKLGGLASTLSGAVSGAARGAVSGVSAIVKPAGELVGHLGSAAGAYIKLGVEAAISAGKQLLVSAASLVVRGALLLWAAAQWILNAALSANPIGIVIIILAALVAAFILAWTHSETFRNIVMGVLHAIGDFFVFVWNSLIKPIFDTFVEHMQQLAGVAQWLWEHGLKPAFEGIGWAISGVWNNLIKPIFDRFMLGLEGLRLAGWFLWDNGIRPVFDRIGGIVNDVWNYIIRPVLDFIVRKFWDTVNGIGQAWDNLKGFLARPINFVIDWVWNNGLRKAWNAVAGIIPGLGQLGPLGRIPEFAQGGAVPGSGNQDTVPALLTPGEYVLSKKVVEKWGLDKIDAAHQAAKRGTHVSSTRGSDSTDPHLFASGGLVIGKPVASSPPPQEQSSPQRLDVGGVIGGALRGIASFLGSLKSWIRDVIDGWTIDVINMLPQPPPEFLAIPRAVADRLRHLTLDWLLGQRAPDEKKQFRAGGLVPGSGNQDTVSALLTPGEFVLNKRLAQALGIERLIQLNTDSINNINSISTVRGTHAAELFSFVSVPEVPHFAMGGAVTEAFNSVVLSNSTVSSRTGNSYSKSSSHGDASSKEVTIITNVHNPVAEPASDSVARRMRTLSMMGAFS